MTRHGLFLTSLAVAIALAGPAFAEKKGEDDESYTYSQFQDDCDLAGGKAVFTTGTAACDFAEGEDIVCDAGNGEVSGCELGVVTNRLGNNRPTHGGAGQVATTPTAPAAPTHGQTTFQIAPMQLQMQVR